MKRNKYIINIYIMKTNPYTVYNGMVSGYRNMFLSSTVAIGLIGFSQKFKNPRMQFLVSIIGGIIFFLSLFIAYITTSEMKQFLFHNEDKLLDYNINPELWKNYFYVAYIYGLVLLLLGVGYLIRMTYGRIPFI
jgi:hypothetical protein